MPVYRRKWKDRKTGQLRLGSYYFKFVVDGITYKETVKTARTRRQAEEAERQARQDAHEGVYGVRSKKQLFSVFVRDVYLPHVEQHNKRPEHYRALTNMLCQYFAGRSLAQISPLAVETFQRDRLKTLTIHNRPRKPGTVNVEMTTLSAIFALAVSKKLLRENPCAGVSWLDQEEGPGRRLTVEEEEALLAAAEEGRRWLKPMLQLALWTGLRQGELIALAKPAIDFGRNRLYVVNPKYKRDKRRTKGVPMGRDVRALVERLCAEAPGELLFPDAEGQKLDRHAVRYAFLRACERAGITALRFHDLRHEYGSRLGDADVNLKKIMELMGHTNTRQTEKYVHPDDEQLLVATEIATLSRPRIVPARLKAVG